MHHPLAEEIFLAALLQDVGMLALDQARPGLYRGGEAMQRDHAALADMERKRLQTDHAEVGGWLMRNWNLPERLHLAIEHSHRSTHGHRRTPQFRTLRRAVRPGRGPVPARADSARLPRPR